MGGDEARCDEAKDNDDEARCDEAKDDDGKGHGAKGDEEASVELC